MNDQSTTQNDTVTPTIINDSVLSNDNAQQPSSVVDPRPVVPNSNSDNKQENEVEVSEEEKELKQALIPFEKFPKLKKWALLFTDINNKATYGNRTESAMQAYDCKDRISAATIGAQNFRKLKGLATLLAEDKGVTVEKFITSISARALTSDNPEWAKLFASITDIYDPKAPSVTINNNTQNNQFNINGDEAENFSKKFKDFLEKE